MTYIIDNILQAEPLFKDKKKFVEMADPLLEGNYPTKGLYQALAVAAMCLQEEASSRPLISDVVTALEYLVVSHNDKKETIPQRLPSQGSKTQENTNSNNLEEDHWQINNEGEMTVQVQETFSSSRREEEGTLERS